MKKEILIFCFFLSFHLGYSQQDTLLHLSFNTADTGEKKTNAYNISTIKNEVAYVPALFGQGIRTDGYSTYVAAGFPEALVPLTVDGWFALETYPTDTAGFLAIKNQASSNWISACINSFGYPLIGIHSANSTRYFSTDTVLSKFEWLNVSLAVNDNYVNLFINGKEVIKAPREEDKDPQPGFDSVIIGRDERIQRIGIFPLNYINGIIDEVTILKGAANELTLFNNNTFSVPKPDLNIPTQWFEKDFNRPKYHLLPLDNWTNESHGLIYYKGLYHIFDQKNGANLILRRINWGHFSSPDLLHWTEHRPILTPQPGYDQLGIWSGHCIIGPDGKLAIIYTGASSETSFGMCLAFPEDDSLLQWKKYSGNPVIKGPPPGYERFDFRDPYLWKANNAYYMAVGFGTRKDELSHGALLLYKSSDLKSWTFLHTLFEGNSKDDNSGIFWEMPVFWKEHGKYILLVNKVPDKGEPANALYWVGDFVNEKFVPDFKIPKKLEVINQLLSPSVTRDENGSTTAIAIIPDLITQEAQYVQGWTHVFSIPQVWTLKNDKIIQQPHPNLKSLRNTNINFENKKITPTKPFLLSAGNHQLEIEVDIDPLNCSRFGFVVGKNPENNEYTRIIYDFTKQEFSVNKSNSSQNKYIPPRGRKGAYSLQKNKKVNIRMFIDGSVTEVFINNEDAFTTRTFPSHFESNNVEMFCEGGNIQLLHANVWTLNGTNNKSNF